MTRENSGPEVLAMKRIDRNGSCRRNDASSASPSSS